MPYDNSDAFVHDLSAIESLPAEILENILNRLEITDLKALRLSSPILEEHAIRPLFRSLKLSHFKYHYEKFLEVSKHSRLALCVKEIVWYEFKVSTFHSIGEIRRSFGLQYYTVDPKVHLPEANLLDYICKGLSDERDTYFWWPRKEQLEVERHPNPTPGYQKVFKEKFEQALNRMPLLRSFISKPCPSSVRLPYKSYSLTVGDMDVIHAGAETGILLMLQYCIQNRGQIQSLTLMYLPSEGSCARLTQYHEPAFELLSTIDLFSSILTKIESLGRSLSVFAPQNISNI